MEISYNELRCKEVVNLRNGARMGRMIDMIIDTSGKDVLGIVVPGVRKIFKANEDIFVPWGNITKIGEDVILISLDVNSATSITKSKCKEKDCCDVCNEDFIA